MSMILFNSLVVKHKYVLTTNITPIFAITLKGKTLCTFLWLPYFHLSPFLHVDYHRQQQQQNIYIICIYKMLYIHIIYIHFMKCVK